MAKLLIAVIFSLLLLVPVGAQNAFAIVIDDYTAPSGVVVGGPATANQIKVDAGILGGERDMNLQGVGPGLTFMVANLGVLTYTQGHLGGSNTVGLIVYDGQDNSIAIDNLGLGGVDLTTGGHDRFLLNVQSSDCDTLSFNVISGIGSSTLIIVPTVGIMELEYTSFVGNAVFSQVGAITMAMLTTGSTPCTIEIIDFRTGAAVQQIGGEIIPIQTTSLILAENYFGN